LKKIGAITSPTEGYLSVGTQRGNGVRNIFRLAEKRWKIIPIQHGKVMSLISQSFSISSPYAWSKPYAWSNMIGGNTGSLEF
jgi:hypothetical protein